MTFAVPVTLLDLRAALRETCQLDANDPRADNTTLNKLINAAYHRMQVANPNGWPWDFAESTVTLTPGVDTISLPIGTGVGNPTKLRHAILQDPGGTWEYPLERYTRWAQLEAYPTDSERRSPATFSILGQVALASGVLAMCIKLRPAPDLAYNLVLGMAAPGPELVADADPAPATNDYMIGEWSSTLLEYAEFLVWRAKGDLTEALNGAKQAFDADVIVLRRSGRVGIGPGRSVVNPIADVEAL